MLRLVNEIPPFATRIGLLFVSSLPLIRLNFL